MDTDHGADHGFSFVELLTVLVLIAAVAGLAFPAYSAVVRVFYDGMAISDLVAARTAVHGDTAKLLASGIVVTSGPAPLAIAPHVRVSPGVRLTVEASTTRKQPSGKGKGLESAPGQNRGDEVTYIFTATHRDGSVTYEMYEDGAIGVIARQ
jgi:prepilin-type N-terminal cleavage/methylation domain-containing protein